MYKTTLCRDCWGDGFNEFYDRMLPWEAIFEPCPTCEGAGEVELVCPTEASVTDPLWVVDATPAEYAWLLDCPEDEAFYELEARA